jgi:DNA-binding transcriptional MocR family regulator
MRTLVRNAREEGVGVHSSAPFYLDPPSVCELILGYGALQERDIREGIRRLSTAIQAFH